MPGEAAGPAKGQRHFAVVGAGMAGLACARELATLGVRATVFERASQPGGRLASQFWEGAFSDIGAQFLTARTDLFAAQVRGWEKRGLLHRWSPTLAEFDKGGGRMVTSQVACFVGAPSMQGLAAAMADGLDIVFDARVGRIARGSAEWFLFDANDRPLGIAGFDGVVLALPSGAALELVRALAEFAPEAVGGLPGLLEQVAWEPCWVASVALSRPSGIEFDVAFIRDDPLLVWAAREASKPSREPSTNERWLLQARATWSKNFAQLPPDEAGRWMQRAFAARLARPLQQKACLAVHWACATPVRFIRETFLWDPSRAFGLAGDWCGGASVETAFLSGRGIAHAIGAA